MNRLSQTIALLALLAWPTDVLADIPGFGNFSGFTVNQADGGSPATFTPGAIRLTTGGFDQVRSIFHNTPQPISKFNASFTYRAVNAFDSSVSIGAAFVLQNIPDGQQAIGTGGGGLGYRGIADSAAVTVGLGNAAVSTTGFFTGGVVGGGGSSISPVNLFSGNPIEVEVVYDGSILQTSFRDTVTSDFFQTASFANLPSIIGSPTAYVGFTASTGFGTGADQHFSDFQFTAVPEPASVVLASVVAAIGVMARRRMTSRR